MKCKIKVSDKTSTVTPTCRPDLGPDSDPELHFLPSALREYQCDRERQARLEQLQVL